MDTNHLSVADNDFIRDISKLLQRDIALGRDCGGLVTTISNRLDRFHEQTQQSCTWGRVYCKSEETGQSNILNSTQITISGPAPEDRFELTADSEKEASELRAHVATLDAACNTLREIEERFLEASGKRQELAKEQAGLRQPADTTVEDHIRLLRQYNKTKDVGQQLIGLIAESRAVPLATVYQDGAYGVGPDD